MLTRGTRFKLIAFVLVAVVAVAYSLLRFTDIGRAIGQDGYTVTAQFEEPGGIFTGAELTYRGHGIGRVGELRLADHGLDVDLEVEHDAPEIPSDLDAVVGNRSAIGEQYIDLRPRAESGPFLGAGDVIPNERTSIPVGVDQAIVDLNRLAESVPNEELRTLVDESFLAFSGAGEDLQQLMDTTTEFVGAARENLPQTVQLLRSGNQVLETQNEEADNFQSFSRDLNLLSEQLVESDGDIRDLIDATPRAADEIDQVIRETGPELSRLIANLRTVAEIQQPRLDGLEQVLVSYPILAVGADAVLNEDGAVRLGLVTNLFDPPPCTRGYEDTERRAGTDTEPVDPNPDAHCAEPEGSPIAVRGSQNAPEAGVPTVPDPSEVDAQSGRSADSLRSEAERQADPDDAGTQSGSEGQGSAEPPGVTDGPGLEHNNLRDLLGLSG